MGEYRSLVILQAIPIIVLFSRLSPTSIRDLRPKHPFFYIGLIIAYIAISTAERNDVEAMSVADLIQHHP